MPSLKSLGIACTLGTSVLLGCSTYSADLKNPGPQTSPTVSLQSHHWALKNALTPQGTPDTQWHIPATTGRPARTIQLDFAEDRRLSVSNLCNHMNSSYATKDSHIQIGRFFSTLMACNDDALMQLERHVAQQLPHATSWKLQNLDAPILELSFENGAVWQLQGTPTYESLYGDSARVFLEVAAQKVPCQNTSASNTECLQVREVQYNDQGIQQSKGPWMTYPGTIEKYTHQSGVRNVLRLKRFTNQKAAGKTPHYVDVLDLVVESEIQR